MSGTPTAWSGSSWFRGRRRLITLLAVAVAVVLVGILAARSCGAPRSLHPDLGPGPVRGVRLTTLAASDGEQTCTGVPERPVVRLVEQVNVDRMTVCLGPGRRADTYPLEPFILDAADPDGERLLDAWAAAWSLPDEQVPWWQDAEEIACPAIAISYPPAAISVTGVTMRPVPPSGLCQPLPAALTALADIAQAARPA